MEDCCPVLTITVAKSLICCKRSAAVSQAVPFLGRQANAVSARLLLFEVQVGVGHSFSHGFLPLAAFHHVHDMSMVIGWKQIVICPPRSRKYSFLAQAKNPVRQDTSTLAL